MRRTTPGGRTTNRPRAASHRTEFDTWPSQEHWRFCCWSGDDRNGRTGAPVEAVPSVDPGVEAGVRSRPNPAHTLTLVPPRTQGRLDYSAEGSDDPGVLSSSAGLDLRRTFGLGGTACQRLSRPRALGTPSGPSLPSPLGVSSVPRAASSPRSPASDPRQPRTVDDAELSSHYS